MGIATNPAATRYAIAFMTVSMGAENAAFAAFGDTLHTPLPLLSAECRAGSRPPPDESILKRAPPEVEEPSPKRRVSQPIQTRVQTEEEMLAEALALSMGVLPGAVNNDDADEDDLAAAIRLSMAVQPESTGTAMPAPGTAAPPTAERPKTAEQKKQLQDKVKALFEELRRSGMPPNEAAQKALAEARRLGF
jgi:hypothetical protein